MRYDIKNGKIVESVSIDAPYDTYQDAEEALDNIAAEKFDKQEAQE